jgi:hypothetical protein
VGSIFLETILKKRSDPIVSHGVVVIDAAIPTTRAHERSRNARATRRRASL